MNVGNFDPGCLPFETTGFFDVGADVGLDVVGFAVGFDVGFNVGLDVVGFAVGLDVGLDVVGLDVVGFDVVGFFVVGFEVLGTLVTLLALASCLLGFKEE